MQINGLWLTTPSNYIKNHMFFKSWRRNNIRIQSVYELSEALMAVKQTSIDFVFMEDEFIYSINDKLHMKALDLKIPWIFKICSDQKSSLKNLSSIDFNKCLIRPFLQDNFEDILLQIKEYKKGYELRSRSESKKTFIIPETEHNLSIPVIQAKKLCYVREKKNGTLVQFDDGVTYNYKTTFKTFSELTQTHSNILEITPGLLINLYKLENIVYDEQQDEFICSLLTEKNIELTKEQRDRLVTHIENHFSLKNW